MAKPVQYGEFDPTTSDGCTVVDWFFRYFTKEHHLPFKECCIEHDRVYYYGGDLALRKQADDDLRDCVKSHGYPILAWAMWFFVRVTAHPKMPFPWAWCEKVLILPKERDPSLKR